MSSSRDGFDYVVDMVNWVRHARIFGLRCIGIVDHALRIDADIFEQRVASNGLENIGFVFAAKLDHLGVTAAFKIKYTAIVPTVFIVTDELALRVGRQGGLTGTRESKENCYLAIVTVLFSIRIYRPVWR